MTLWEVYSHFYELSLTNWFPYRELLDDLNDALEIKDGDLILDAGCGPGIVIEKAIRENAAKGISVVGIDSSRGMISRAGKRCKNLPNVKFEVADLNKNLDFPDNSFDKVVCCNTLYALDNPQRVMSEFCRILKPGGAVIVANPKPGDGMQALVREHVRTLRSIGPFYKKTCNILMFGLLLPVNLVVVAIDRIIIGRARRREYHFLDRESLLGITQGAGFGNIIVKSCYADQNWLVRATKQRPG